MQLTKKNVKLLNLCFLDADHNFSKIISGVFSMKIKCFPKLWISTSSDELFWSNCIHSYIDKVKIFNN